MGQRAKAMLSPTNASVLLCAGFALRSSQGRSARNRTRSSACEVAILDSDNPRRLLPVKIFISYRRGSSASYASKLARDLIERFGDEYVFIDTLLHGGSTWPKNIRAKLGDARIVLVIIDRSWLSAVDEWNRRRIDLPDDWVRLEVELSLKDPDKLVIPILLDGASIPPASALPAEIADLPDRQARTLERRRWRLGVNALVEDIEHAVDAARRTGRCIVDPNSGAILSRYNSAQFHRITASLNRSRLEAGGYGRGRQGSTRADLIVPDLLPFRVDEPSTDHLTVGAARQLRRAATDRSRLNVAEVIDYSRTLRLVIVGGPGSGKTTLLI